MKETVSGVVSGIIFRNKEDGFSVFNVSSDLASGPFKMVGQSEAMPGQNIVAKGEWIKMPATAWQAAGLQFKADAITASLPSTIEGITRYLSSGIIRGVGEKAAGRIVARFGLDTIDVIEN